MMEIDSVMLPNGSIVSGTNPVLVEMLNMITRSITQDLDPTDL
jgi:hypothetical protein